MEELEIVIEKEIDGEQLINVLEEEIREIHPNYEELTILPTTEEITKVGTYNKVTVAGDSDLIPDNIKEGTNIFGVEGTAKTTSAKITDAQYLFYNGARTDCVNGLLSLCDNIASARSMFYNCSNLTELDLSNLDTSKVANMTYMFYNCSNLKKIDLSSFDTSRVTSMDSMFTACYYLTELDLSSFDTSSVITMQNMFSGCHYLTELDLSSFDTSNVTNMSDIFSGCRYLTELDLSSFDMSKVTNNQSMFYRCLELTTLNSFKNLGKGYTQKTNNYSNYKFDLTYDTKLTKESLIDVITNGLYDLNLTYDVANGGTLYTQKFILGSNNMAKLTADELAIGTAKGWTIS